MKKLNYVLKNTFINMRRNPLLVVARKLAVLVSSFLVFTTLSARAIVENNTSRWQNGVHVVIFLDDRSVVKIKSISQFEFMDTKNTRSLNKHTRTKTFAYLNFF